MKYAMTFLMILLPVIVQAADDVPALQRELEAQRAQIQSQQKQFDEQEQKPEQIDQRMKEVAGGATASQSAAAGHERVLSVIGLTVLLSVFVHGPSAVPLSTCMVVTPIVTP